MPKKTAKILFRDSPLFDKIEFERLLWGTKYQEANIEYYHEAMLNWSDAEGAKKLNWLSAAFNWMLRDMTNNRFKTKDQPINGQGTNTKGIHTGQEQLSQMLRTGIKEVYGK